MDKRTMRDGDAFMQAYRVLQSLETAERKTGILSRSFRFGSRAITVGQIIGTLASLFVLTVLGFGFFVWVKGSDDSSTYAALHDSPGAPAANHHSSAGTASKSSTPSINIPRTDSVPKTAPTAQPSANQPELSAQAGKISAEKPGATASPTIPGAAVTSQVAGPPAATPDTAVSKQQTSKAEPKDLVASERKDTNLASNQLALEGKGWARIKDSRKPADFQMFLERYPAGPYSSAAIKASRQLQWDGVNKDNVNSLQSYLNQNPQSPFAAEARQRLTTLQQIEKARQARAEEESAWNSLDRGSAAAIQHFLGRYPKGGHTSDAQELFRGLSKREEASKLALADDNAWAAISSSRERHSLERYLSEFPSGRHTDQARQSLAEISAAAAAASREENAVVATLKRYSDAWKAKDVADITALRPGLARGTAKEELAGTRSIKMRIEPTSIPKIQGDHATVECIRQVDQVFTDGTAIQKPGVKITFFLVKREGAWLIAESR